MSFSTRVVPKLMLIPFTRTSNAIYRNSDKAHVFCSTLLFQQALANVCTSNRFRVTAGFVKTIAKILVYSLTSSLLFETIQCLSWSEKHFFWPIPRIFDKIRNRKHPGERKFSCGFPRLRFISLSLFIFSLIYKNVVEKVAKIAYFFDINRFIHRKYPLESRNWIALWIPDKISIQNPSSKKFIWNVTVFWFFNLQYNPI